MTIGKDAARIAGNPSMGHTIVTSSVASLAAGVGGYQINSALSRRQGVPAPTLSPATGGMPDTTAQTLSQSIHKSRKQRKGGK